MNRYPLRTILPLVLFATSDILAQGVADARPTEPGRPNILWVYVEDTNDWMSCYGDDVVQTPNIDALATRGTRFTRAYMPAGVCTPTRSAVMVTDAVLPKNGRVQRGGRQSPL